MFPFSIQLHGKDYPRSQNSEQAAIEDECLERKAWEILKL